jgi:TfoX/Sxy family transcriptional regulator of competence genes
MSHPPITAEECYATIVEALGSLPDVTQWEKKRFGSTGLSIRGKIFAMLLKDKLVVKLPKARVTELIERRVGERFELGQKRMKEWVTLEPTSEEGWLHLSREAMEFVASQR